MYFIASLFYANGIAEELNDRLSFSVGPIWHSQRILLVALVIVACGSFYLGYAAEIERAGFSIPPYLVEIFMDRIGEGVSKLLLETAGGEAIAKFREQLEGTLQEMAKEVSRFLPEEVGEVAVARFRDQSGVDGHLSASGGVGSDQGGDGNTPGEKAHPLKRGVSWKS